MLLGVSLLGGKSNVRTGAKQLSLIIETSTMFSINRVLFILGG